MKHQLALKIASLISILLFSLHWADDIARGIDRGGISGIWGLVILVLWLYATVVLAERRSGLVLILIASVLASVVPVFHMRGGWNGRRTHRWLQRSVLLDLDPHCARRGGDVLRSPLWAELWTLRRSRARR